MPVLRSAYISMQTNLLHWELSLNARPGILGGISCCSMSGDPAGATGRLMVVALVRTCVLVVHSLAGCISTWQNRPPTANES